MENKGFYVKLHENSLKYEVIDFNEDIDIHDLIECDTLDHTTVFDELEERNIDVWVDDEGLLKDRNPVFIFTDEKTPTGYIVGNVVFSKCDRDGNTIGLNEEEKDYLIAWLCTHQFVMMDEGMLRGKQPSYNFINSFIIDKKETEQHRKRIEDMKQWVKDLGGEIMEF